MALVYIEHSRRYSLAIWKREESADALSSLLSERMKDKLQDSPAASGLPEAAHCPHKTEKRRQEFFTCRLSALALGISPTLISKHPCGRPLLNDGKGFISFSHCQDYAAVLYSHDEAHLGIDMEKESPRLPKVAGKFMSDAELTHINRYFKDETSRIKALTLYWTIKEALFKAVHSKNIDFQKSFQIELVKSIEEALAFTNDFTNASISDPSSFTTRNANGNLHEIPILEKRILNARFQKKDYRIEYFFADGHAISICLASDSQENTLK